MTNRQETKNAKKSCTMPRNTLGDFETVLASLANLTAKDINTQKGDH
jgi:hypothetical protein